MKFCNINFNQRNISDLFERADEDRVKIIIPVNAALIADANKSERFFDILNRNYVIFDGRVPHLTAQVLCRFGRISPDPKNEQGGKRFDFKKMSGSDIVYDFCEFALKNNYKIFFLGGNSESNRIAVDNIKARYGIMIDGYSPEFENYPFSSQFNDSCLREIAAFKPDILFVGFGAPKQEYWIDDHTAFLDKIGVKYAIGCGGTFDFVSQKIKRAPLIIQKTGFEGVYRLLQEPGKMRFWRLIDSCKFFRYINHKPRFDPPARN